MTDDSGTPSFEATLRRDDLWEAFNIGSYASFSEHVSEMMQRREELPEDVEGRLRVIEALLCHSYFEYDFLDVAMERMLFTFEMALRTRMDEIGILDQDARRNLVDCIGNASDAHLFEDGDDAAHTLRKFRNRCAHPKRNWRRGPAAIQIIERVTWIINGLYDDPDLRAKRHREREKLQSVLNDCIDTGGVARGIPSGIPMGGEEVEPHKANLLLHDVKVLYVNNHGVSPEYHLALFPIFDVCDSHPDDKTARQGDRQGGLHFPPPIYLTVTEWEQGDGSEEIRFTLEAADSTLCVAPIQSEENRRRYTEKWEEKASSDRRLAIEERYREAFDRRNALMRRQRKRDWQSGS